MLIFQRASAGGWRWIGAVETGTGRICRLLLVVVRPSRIARLMRESSPRLNRHSQFGAVKGWRKAQASPWVYARTASWNPGMNANIGLHSTSAMRCSALTHNAYIKFSGADDLSGYEYELQLHAGHTLCDKEHCWDLVSESLGCASSLHVCCWYERTWRDKRISAFILSSVLTVMTNWIKTLSELLSISQKRKAWLCRHFCICYHCDSK